MARKILFVPSVRPEGGWGHLNRCREAARAVGGRLWAPEGRPEQISEELWQTHDPFQEPWDLIVFDRRKTERDLYRAFAERGWPLVGWDEGAACRSRMDFLVDSLGNTSRIPPNCQAPGLMDLGPHRVYTPKPVTRVLVAFGGTDRHHLAVRLLKSLNRLPDLKWEVSVLEGPWQDRSDLPLLHGRRPSLLSRPQRLRDHLQHFDLVFCSYGITAHECRNQGVPFLLVEPSRYHARLSRRKGWPLLGVRGVSVRKLVRFLEKIQDPRGLSQLYHQPMEPEEPHALWRRFRSHGRFCPACGSARARVVNRQKDRTFYRCRDCGFLYLLPWLVPEKDYGPQYFEDEYRSQYGKTYLQDFPNIEALGARRLTVLQRLSGPLQGRRLLDLGCAYGPFLAAAQKKGMVVEGADVNPQAVAWVQRELGVPATCLNLGVVGWEKNWPERSFDAVSLWYVIEHFPDLQTLFQGLRYLLRPQGWLLLSTPNAAGLTARFHPGRFFRESPTDHYTLWEPVTARRLLDRHDFQIRWIEPTGIHPERLLGRPLGRWWTAGLAALQRWLRWGDTMEIYARRLP